MLMQQSMLDLPGETRLLNSHPVPFEEILLQEISKEKHSPPKQDKNDETFM
jgi:hypothetical protein